MMEAGRLHIAFYSTTGWVGSPIRQFDICAGGNGFEVNFNAASRGMSGYNRSKSHVDF